MFTLHFLQVLSYKRVFVLLYPEVRTPEIQRDFSDIFNSITHILSTGGEVKCYAFSNQYNVF